ALEPAPGQVVLVVPTSLSREVRHEHRPSYLLHDKRLVIAETPSIRCDRCWGRLLFDPEKVTELLELGGQAHRLPPRVRHALRSSMGCGEPGINGEGRVGRTRSRRRQGEARDAAGRRRGARVTAVGAVRGSTLLAGRSISRCSGEVTRRSRVSGCRTAEPTRLGAPCGGA